MDEELRILLRTIADTRGADQVRNSLQQVRTAATTAQAPVRGLNASFMAGAQGAAGFASALTGVTLGVGLVAVAASQLKEGIASSIQAQIDSQRVARATAAAYGSSADSFTRFSVALSAQTGFTKNAILEAALSARTLSDNYGLSIAQTQKLISVSADLARVRGIGVAEAFERVQSAIRGEAEASEFLGLTLNATFLQQNAQNGALRQTFTTLTDVQKAQVVYNEVLRQTEKFTGLAAAASNGLEGSFSRLNLAAVNLQENVGKGLAPGVTSGANALTFLVAEADKAIARLMVLRQLMVLPKDAPLFQLQDSLKSQGSGLIENSPLVAMLKTAIPLAKELKQTLQETAGGQVFQNLSGAVASLSPGRQSGAPLSREFTGEFDALRQPSVSDLAAAALARERADRERAERENRRLLALNQNLPTQTAERGFAQIAFLDQIDAAQRDLLALETAQRDIQREQRDLVIEEANQILAILPQRQAIAHLERQITDQVNQRLRLQQEAAHIAAEQRAAPAQNALEDTQNAIARARLVLADRKNQSPEARAEARATIRDVRRSGTLTGQELAAFDANQGIRDVERGQRATDLQTRAAQSPLQQLVAAQRAAIKPQEDGLVALRDHTERLDQIARINIASIDRQTEIRDAIINAAVAAAARAKEPIPITGTLTIELKTDGVVVQVFEQGIEGLGQVQAPPVVQSSGVRR